ERVLDEPRALDLLHAELAEIEQRVGDVGHRLGVALDHLEGECFALVGRGLTRERKHETERQDSLGRAVDELVLHEIAPHGTVADGWHRVCISRLLCHTFRSRTATQESCMRFEGTSAYVATDDLKVAVNAAITLERPLLVKGEPGTGKTVLALEIAKSLSAPLIEWHIKSTTKALQGLYEYDAVSRLRDSQLGDERVQDIRNYIKRGKLWDAFVSDARPVLLIDEIDKADIEFPNDLLLELDRMEFFVYETAETIKARRRPIVVITSNNEKELPDAFLRRCFFHYIRFPDPDTMRAIIEVHFPGIKQRLVSEALKLFYEIRDVPGMKKNASNCEFVDG